MLIEFIEIGYDLGRGWGRRSLPGLIVAPAGPVPANQEKVLGRHTRKLLSDRLDLIHRVAAGEQKARLAAFEHGGERALRHQDAQRHNHAAGGDGAEDQFQQFDRIVEQRCDLVAPLQAVSPQPVGDLVDTRDQLRPGQPPFAGNHRFRIGRPDRLCGKDLRQGNSACGYHAVHSAVSDSCPVALSSPMPQQPLAGCVSVLPGQGHVLAGCVLHALRQLGCHVSQLARRRASP